MPAGEPVEHQCGVVVHPGKARSRGALDAVRRAIRHRGWPDPLVNETSADSPGAGQVGELLAQGVDRLVVVGGDGTVREVASALARSGPAADRVTLGVVPTGKANLWARTVGIHGTGVDVAADVALDGPTRDSDLAWLTLTRADGGRRRRRRA
jgi:diacylglycerol kinase family enzyme